ncbi:MAG: ABC transporter permease [Anaerolineales bacterium]|nr:MAG: ABC transporter permease [Chloroflexota bacterium]MBE7433065.1 ABC transporter permease [Anaerolineales bacterium]MCE7860097.1 ABC transporter permease [Chloroflexi bacterium CFX2]
MSLYLRIAWRNVWRHRRRTFLIAIGMGVTMAMLVLYDGLIGGFEQAIYGNAIQLLGGNIQVHAPGYSEKAGRKPLLPLDDPEALVRAAESQPNVVVASKRIVTGGLVTNREGAFAITIVGVETDKEGRITPVSENISSGRYLLPDDGDVIVIGQGLATAMEIEVGDRITMVGNTTHEQTRQRTMTVIGIYDVGVPSVEKGTIYISLAEAQSLFGLEGQVTEIVISLKQIGQEPGVMDALNTSVPGYEVESWVTSIPDLKKTMDMKTGVMSVFGVFMLGIAAIGILNLLMMAVFERTREIGIVGALGLKPREITFLFLLEGILIGLMGAAIGAILGTAINGILGIYGLDYSQFANLTEYTALISGSIYPQLVPLKVLKHAFTVAIIAALAALYPAIEASRREPAEALHYV